MLMVGQKVQRAPEFAPRDDNNAPRATMEGYVVYIHPKGRFHVVAFPTKGGFIRESFQGVNP